MNCYEKYSTARLLTKEVLKMLPEDRDIGAQLTRVLLLIEERIGAESYYRKHERILSRKKVGYGLSELGFSLQVVYSAFKKIFQSKEFISGTSVVLGYKICGFKTESSGRKRVAAIYRHYAEHYIFSECSDEIFSCVKRCAQNKGESYEFRQMIATIVAQDILDKHGIFISKLLKKWEKK